MDRVFADLAVGEDERLVHDIAQLSDVAAPRAVRERAERLRRPALLRFLDRVQIVEEVLGQQLDVFTPVAQRWQVDREDVEPVIEVFPQLAARHRLAGAAVGRGDDPHVGLDRVVAAHAQEVSRLEHAQELHLELRVHLGDLVEQQRSAGGALEIADVPAVRAREAALLVPEQFALDQIGRDRAAVHREERFVLAPAELVQRLRDELLPGAALAHDSTVAVVGATRAIRL